ncbi:MAG: class I SAM-dependent methyltransferase [Halodesulfurarchaeum sp.]
MRRFTADYLAETRAGLWDDREALAPLSLGDRDCVLDVGCGSGELTRVLRESAPPSSTVIGVDADRRLLAGVPGPRVQADATRLPFADRIADLVVCQALLVNLPDPAGAVREFSRVSEDRVGVIEPDNSEVAVESTVDVEAALAARARDAYIAGIDTDVTLGARAADLLQGAGLQDIETTVKYHRRVVEPPYTSDELEGARRKVTGQRVIEAREALLASGMDPAEYDALLSDWRAMGRTVVEQMEQGTYRRAEVIPFYVTVGRVETSTPV